MVGLAWDCVNSRESKKVLISLLQSRGGYLRPQSAWFSRTMIVRVLRRSGQPSYRVTMISSSSTLGLRKAVTTSRYAMFQPYCPAREMRYRKVVSVPTGISFSEGRLLLAFNYYPCFVLYGAVWNVLRFVDPFEANWLDLQLPCFPGVDTCECVIEQDLCAFFFHCSFPVISLWAAQVLGVCEWIAVDGR